MDETYESFEALKVSRDDRGIVEVRLSGLIRDNTVDRQAHKELATVWARIEADEEARCVFVRGSDRSLSAGGDLDFLESMVQDYGTRIEVLREARSIVTGILSCSRPIVSAVYGSAVGAGLIPALLADISVAGTGARIMDGHTRVGLVAGDHSALIWPLLCGIAKAKMLLMLNRSLSGEEAGRIGLVSTVVDDAVVLEEAHNIAVELTELPRHATEWTKHALNYWLRDALPIFETSLGLEFIGLGGPEAQQAIQGMRQQLG